MSPTACPACGGATAGDLCVHCAPAAAFLGPHPDRRAAALLRAGPSERGLILLAVLRAWPLFGGVHSGEGDLGDLVLGRLATLARNPTWDAYIAEDAVLGAVAWPAVAAAERPRALARAPVWLAEGRPAADRADQVARAFGREPSHIYALAFRLGGSGIGAEVQRARLSSLPGGIAAIAEVARRYGDKYPTENTWRPTEDVLRRARGFRRLPLARLEGAAVCLCGACAEPLPASGPCGWCGREGPPTHLDLYTFLNAREDCPVCGLDLAWAVRPSRCGCCLTPLPIAP